MTAPVGYELGLTLVGMSTFYTLGIPDPEIEPIDYAASFALADGIERGVGFKQASLHYGYLYASQYAAYKVFCPGLSAKVYVSLLNSDLDFVRYYGVMKMPEKEVIRNNKYMDITIMFTFLVEAE